MAGNKFKYYFDKLWRRYYTQAHMTIKANYLDCKYTLWGAVTLKSPITMMYRCLSHHTNPTKGPLYSSESSLELPSSSAVLVFFFDVLFDVLFFISASHSASAFRHPTEVADGFSQSSSVENSHRHVFPSSELNEAPSNRVTQVQLVTNNCNEVGMC